MNRLKVPLAVLLSGLCAAACATAPGWRDYTYPQAGFTIQFPAPPRVSLTTYVAAGRRVPATVWSLRQDGVVYAVQVADLAGAPVTASEAVDGAINTLRQTGQVIGDTTAHIELRFGRAISLADRDGGRRAIQVFYFDHRLYTVSGRALPPDANARTGRIVRFVDTMSFDVNPPPALLAPQAGATLSP